MKNTKYISFALVTIYSLSQASMAHRQGPSQQIEIVGKQATGETLKNLFDRSVQKHPYIKSLQYTKDEKKYSVDATLSTFFPLATISYKAAKINDYSKLKTVLGISATQKIIDLGAAQDLNVAKSQHTLAEYQKRLGNDYVRELVEEAFLAAWLQLQRKEVIASLKKSSQETFEQAKAKWSAGIISRNELLQAATTHTQNLQTIEQYENDLDNAFVDLEKATNLKLRNCRKYPNLHWNPTGKISVPTLDKALSKAKSNRKELLVNEQQTDAALQQELAYKKDYFPTLGLYGTWQRQQDSTADDPYNSHEAGVAVSWGFDSGYSYHNANAYHAKKLKYQEDRLVTLQTIDSEVRTSHNDLLISLRDLQLKDIELSESKDTFERNKTKFKTGLITQTDFDEAIYNWNTAQINWLQQKITAETAKKTLEAKCGYY
ncbi:TolC family protein [Candidatus Dependentiae bacterium]